MNTTNYDEREVTESFYRLGPPALVWAALLAFFAFAGSMSRDEPTQAATQMANVAPAVAVAPALRLMANETDEVPTMALDAASARDPALRDAAIVAHEALDPVGAGLNTRR